MPRILIIANTSDGFVIASDTVAELFDAHSAQPREICTFYTDERLFMSRSRNLFMVSRGPVVVENIFVKDIIQQFCNDFHQQTGVIDIAQARLKFVDFIKSHYSHKQDKLFASLNLSFIKYENSNCIVDAFKVKKSGENYQLQEVQQVVIPKGRFVVECDENRQLIQDQNLGINKAKEEIIKLFVRIFKSNLQPLSMISLATNGDVIAWNRPFLEHPFDYLDDFIEATQQGYYGCNLSHGYRLVDLNELLTITTDSKIPHLHPNQTDDRFITFREFIKICRNRVHRTDLNFFKFYLEIYKLINLTAKNDSLFQHKLNSIIKSGVFFLIERENDPKKSTMAFYEIESRTITLFANLMEQYAPHDRIIIFKHEVVHGYKQLIHRARWLKHEPTILEEGFVNQHSFGTPYFPFTNVEKEKWFSFAKQGLNRIKQLFILLNKKDYELTETEKHFKEKYKAAIIDYMPKQIFQRIGLRPDEALNNPQIHNELNSDISRYLTVNLTMHGIKVPYHIKRIIDFDPKTRLIFVSGYTTLGPKLESAIFDMLFTFNLDMQLQNNYAELHAHIVGEYPLALLSLLFEELIRYDYEDATVALEKPVPEFLSYISPKHEAAQVTLVAPPPVSAKNSSVKEDANRAKVNSSDTDNSSSSNSKEPAIPPAELITAFNSPIAASDNAHEKLIVQLKSTVEENKPVFDGVLESINAKNYSQAIRRCGTKKHAKSIDVMRIILGFKNVLTINLNEKAGKDSQTALHYAAINGDKELYDLLLQNGAVDDKDAKGNLAAIYMAKHLQNEPRLKNTPP